MQLHDWLEMDLLQSYKCAIFAIGCLVVGGVVVSVDIFFFNSSNTSGAPTMHISTYTQKYYIIF